MKSPASDRWIELTAAEKERRRMRALRTYIRRLSLQPKDALEVVHAVAFDLERIADVHGGSIDRACGDGGGQGAHKIDRPFMVVSRVTS